MLTLAAWRNGRFVADIAPDAIAAALAQAGTTLWLDIAQPTPADQDLLAAQFGFHPLAIEDAVRSHERPKVDAYGAPGDADGDGIADAQDPVVGDLAAGRPPADEDLATSEDLSRDDLDELILLPLEHAAAAHTRRDVAGYYLVVFYQTVYNREADHIATHPLNLFIGPNYLVTVHETPVAHIAETMARWRAPRGPLGHRIGALVHALLDALVDDYFPLMDRVADRIEDLEDRIFLQFNDQSIEVMFRLKKDLLAMRRVVAPERDVLNVLLRRQLPIFGPEDVAYLQDVYDHIVRVTDNIDIYRDLLSSAVDSYLSLQSNKLNQIMRTLTVASIILMSAALITGFYGQNFVVFPELHWRIGAGWPVLLMAFTTIGLVIYFRRKGWL
jgi:magnesium transporter